MYDSWIFKNWFRTLYILGTKMFKLKTKDQSLYKTKSLVLSDDSIAF